MTGVLLIAVVAAGAPNDHTIDAAIPLLHLPALAGPASTYLTLAAYGAQGLGLIGMLAALRRGWRPRPRVMFAAGTAAACLLTLATPVGSADMASYAAYGRIASLGLDPYQVVPAQIGGHYAHLVSSIWVRTASVYGPVATFVQRLAAGIGGDRVMVTIGLLMAANAAAYVATGVILVKAAGDRSRAALLWAANPLLLALLVGGGHLDTYVAFFGVCAVVLASRPQDWQGEALIGALLGLACGVKISAALLVLGLSLPLLRARCWNRLLTRSLVCLAVLVLLYAPVGFHAFAPLGGASHLVSTPSFWQLVQIIGHALIGPSATASLISAAWPLVMVAAALLLLRHRSNPEPLPRLDRPRWETPRWEQSRYAHALSLGWNLAAPWCMPWYTAMTWPLTALLPRSRTDYLLVVLTTTLALMHNTGGHGWSW
ncbi:hypothetical protein DN069_32100 [Streptacidiphilus pinicola]|uniref:DUF2029 domain-containing protein n=1 Tax=Streptacidiphilus pinicola TaxID=2219663 RepID=A0A2X0J2G0_9ACTN|nr:hypothetical protein DN069_32100 [Streptacidiphilus pinicola]